MRPIPAALALLLSLGACATTQMANGDIGARDPNEGFNREIWGVNQAIDQGLIRPVAQVYRTITPEPARRGLARVLDNLTEPWSFINNLLQGKPGRAIRNLGRFIVNSTIGVGGLADHATDLGIAPADEDFGQTLASWGVGDGGYLVVPLLGPSTTRDALGSVVSLFANPTTIFLQQEAGFSDLEVTAVRATEIVSTRAELIESGFDTFLETSADPYAAARSAFFQRREAAILDYDAAGLEGVDATEDAAFEAAVEELEADEEELAPEPPVEPPVIPPPDVPEAPENGAGSGGER